MTKAGKNNTRRPVNYWSKFNEWWRLVLEESGRRPDAAAINRWYEEHAHEIWSPNDMPTMLETRIHAKCLRSVDEVRNYFRAYRAQRRADAAARLEANGGDDQGDETDTDTAGAVARITSRRSGGGAGNKANIGSAAQVQRGGICKVVTSAIRPARPHSQSSAQPGPFPRDKFGFNSSGMDTAQATSLADSAAPSAWWPPTQRLQIPSRQQTSAVSGPIAGSSVVITGIPRVEVRYNATSLTQPASPAKADHSAGATVNGQQPCCLNVDVGDLPYDGPCSSVSTASLDDLFDLNDDNHKDDAAFCVPNAGSSALAAAAGHPQAASLGGAHAPMHQHHHQEMLQHVSIHPQPAFIQHQQQQVLLLPHQRPLAFGSAGTSDDLHTIFDDCLGGEPMVHAELTLLPHHKRQHPQPTQGLSSRKAGHGCVETALWQPPAPSQAQPGHAPQHQSAVMAANHCPRQQPQPQQQQSLVSFLCGWPAAPTPRLDTKQQHQQQSGEQPLGGINAAPVAAAGVTWSRGPNGAETSPATPMEGVVCEQGALPSWLPSADVAKPQVTPNDGCAVSSSVPPHRGRQDLASAGPSPDAPSSASHIAATAQIKTEPIEPPQPQSLSNDLWMGTHMDTGVADITTRCVGGSQAESQPPKPQPTLMRNPTWLSLCQSTDSGAVGSSADREQQQLMQVQRICSAPNLGSGQSSASVTSAAHGHQRHAAPQLRPEAGAGRLFQQQPLQHQQPQQQQQVLQPQHQQQQQQQVLRIDVLAPLPVPPLPPFPPRPSSGDRVYHRPPSLGSSSATNVNGASHLRVTITSPWTAPSHQLQQQAPLHQQHHHRQQHAGLQQHQQQHAEPQHEQHAGLQQQHQQQHAGPQNFMATLRGMSMQGHSLSTSASSAYQAGQDASASQPAPLGPPQPSSLGILSSSASNSTAAEQPLSSSRVASWSHSMGPLNSLPSPFIAPHMMQQHGPPFVAPGVTCGAAGSARAGGAPVSSPPGTGRRHSQPGENIQPYVAALQSQPHQQPGQGHQVGCLMTDLLQRWPVGDLPGGPGGPSRAAQTEKDTGVMARGSSPRALQDRNVNTGAVTATAGLAPSGQRVTTAVATCGGVDPPTATAARPTLVRTLSAPACDGFTPRAQAAATAAAAAAAVVAAAAGTNVLPATSVPQPQPAQPGATPRHQPLALGGLGSFGTPGLGVGFNSPASCWGDRALAELEGDSWFSSMLGPELTPSFF